MSSKAGRQVEQLTVEPQLGSLLRGFIHILHTIRGLSEFLGGRTQITDEAGSLHNAGRTEVNAASTLFLAATGLALALLNSIRGFSPANAEINLSESASMVSGENDHRAERLLLVKVDGCRVVVITCFRAYRVATSASAILSQQDQLLGTACYIVRVRPAEGRCGTACGRKQDWLGNHVCWRVMP